jgi:Leucine-rich repeat (LRR) protein
LQYFSFENRVFTQLAKHHYVYNTAVFENTAVFFQNCRKTLFPNTPLLSDNQLQGAIPDSVGNLSNSSLQYLYFGKNNLSGAVPESMGNLIALNELVLEQNNLTGPIGSWVGKLNNLVKLYLSDNNFSGPIPSSIGGFTQLTNISTYRTISLKVQYLQVWVNFNIYSN